MFEVQTASGGVKLIVHGDVDDANITAFEATLGTLAVNFPAAAFDVDLRACEYINSHVIAMLVRLSHDRPTDFLVTVAPAGCVFRILEICGMLEAPTFVRVDRALSKALDPIPDHVLQHVEWQRTVFEHHIVERL